MTDAFRKTVSGCDAGKSSWVKIWLTMSTTLPPSSDPELPAEPAVSADAPEPVAVEPEAKVPLIRRLPTGVFTAGYGALLAGVAVFGVVLASYEVGADSPAYHVDRPARPAPAPPPPGSEVAAASNVVSSVRDYLISDVETNATLTGVTLTGNTTDQAEADTAELAGHVSRLLQQNCVDNLTLRTQDNLRINVWGYCLHSPSAETLQSYIDVAVDEGADAVSFMFYPGRSTERQVAMTWQSDTEAEAEDIAAGWKDIPQPDDVDSTDFVVYGPENVRQETSEESLTVSPTGEKFREEIGNR
ncbi:hypothetical protein CAPI_03745 [Corynebacterium capitovis DSM 44611]|nr:hypothetical protein CAPI_03745 [Corynebacterium capitovis DSM 44611]